MQLPQEPAYLGHLCFGALLDALGDTVTLPETLEFADYCAFGGDTYLQSLTLPESPVVCATGLMLYSTGQRNEFGMPDESRAYFANAIMNPVAGAALADDGSLEAALAEWSAEHPVEKVTASGDVDCSGEINIADAILLARWLSEDRSITIMPAGIADANLDGDSTVSGADLAILLERLAKSE